MLVHICHWPIYRYFAQFMVRHHITCEMQLRLKAITLEHYPHLARMPHWFLDYTRSSADYYCTYNCDW